MFAQEPGLKFIAPQHLTHNQVIRAIVPKCRSTPRQLPGLANDNLVSIEQSRQLNWDFFPATRRPLDLCSLSHIGGHGHADTSQQLNSFGDRVNNIHLLTVMLVVKQMQLVEGRTSHLPMTLLVQVAKRHRVGEKLIQLFRHLQSHGFFEFQRQHMADRPVGLDFPGALMKSGLSKYT